MIIIFSFSAKPAVNSNETSLKIAERVLTVFEKATGIEYAGDKRADVLGAINHVVRKGGHFCEFALLACTFVLHLLVLKKKEKYLLFAPIILSALYAATDELHQLFIPGRSCQLSDVLLDSCGAATGSVFFAIFMVLYSHHKKKRKLAATLSK